MAIAPSAAEAFLARSAVVLEDAATLAGPRVHRGRPDAFAYDELPAINQRRADGQFSPHGRGADQSTLEFELDLVVAGEDWETVADQLHREAHLALLADSTLATLGAGLMCARTRCSADSGDRLIGRLTATYQVQHLVKRGELTTYL